MTIVNDDSRVINKHEASLTDNARVVIYDGQMFIVQATERFVVDRKLPCWACMEQVKKRAYRYISNNLSQH
jgi:hypothetical protein